MARLDVMIDHETAIADRTLPNLVIAFAVADESATTAP
jgi:hypothetical protein